MCIYIIVNRHYYFSLQSDLRACSLSVSGEGGVGDTCTRNCLNAWIMLIHMSSLVLFAFLCFQNKKMMATLHCKPLECMCPGCVLEFNLAMWNSFCDLSITEDIGFPPTHPSSPFFHHSCVQALFTVARLTFQYTILQLWTWYLRWRGVLTKYDVPGVGHLTKKMLEFKFPAFD